MYLFDSVIHNYTMYLLDSVIHNLQYVVMIATGINNNIGNIAVWGGY